MVDSIAVPEPRKVRGDRLSVGKHLCNNTVPHFVTLVLTDYRGIKAASTAMGRNAAFPAKKKGPEGPFWYGDTSLVLRPNISLRRHEPPAIRSSGRPWASSLARMVFPVGSRGYPVLLRRTRCRVAATPSRPRPGGTSSCRSAARSRSRRPFPRWWSCCRPKARC